MKHSRGQSSEHETPEQKTLQTGDTRASRRQRVVGGLLAATLMTGGAALVMGDGDHPKDGAVYPTSVQKEAMEGGYGGPKGAVKPVNESQAYATMTGGDANTHEASTTPTSIHIAQNPDNPSFIVEGGAARGVIDDPATERDRISHEYPNMQPGDTIVVNLSRPHDSYGK